MAKTSRTLSRNPVAGNGRSPAAIVASANRWRESYNPLRSLVISTIVARLEEGERGQYQDLMWLERFVEKRFPVLRALILRRRSALLKLDWDIKTVSELPEGFTEAQAEAQQEFLRAKYDAILNLREAIKALALAEFRGFALLQKHRDESGAITELHWLPQWHFCRDGQFGDFYFDERSQSASPTSLGEENRIGGEALPREEFLIRECDMPVNEIALRAFQSWNMGVKDWAAFVELYGLPGCVIEMPPNIPPGKETAYETAAGQVAEGSSGTIPSGAKPHFPTAQIRGNSPFKEFVDAQISDVVLAGTGGKLTMLNEATGIGGSQGEVHQDAFDDIAQGEAMEISEVFQRDFDRGLLAVQFPGQPVLAYFELAAADEEDKNEYVNRVVSLNGAGYRTDPEEVSEKTGHELGVESITLADGPETNSGAVAGASDVAATALNGAQVTALAGLAEQVAQGQLPLETAKSIAVAAFPMVASSTIEKIFSALKTFTPEPPPSDPQSPSRSAEPKAPADESEKEDGGELRKSPEDEPVKNRAASSTLNPPSSQALAAAVAADLQPLRDRLARILQIEAPDVLKAKLQAFLAELPQLLKDINADPESARVLEALAAPALAQGLTEKASIANRNS